MEYLISASPWPAMIYFFIIGACVGSFLNVVIYRLPAGKSLVRPGSHCPKCGAPIKPWHNIPVLSYLILRGRCAECGENFSPRYMAVELITAALFSACAVKFGVSATGIVMMALTASLVAITFIDIDHMIIPDVITLPGIIIGLACSWLFLPTTVADAVIGALVGGGLFLLLAVAVPGGMGGGDIKLMAMLGSFLGLKAVLITIFLGSIAGSGGGLIGIAVYGKGRKSKIPFGPYLVIGALAAVFWEDEIVRFYIDTFVRKALY